MNTWESGDDWREELILRSTDNSELRIYSTTILTTIRQYTLMYDSQYRLAIAWQNVGYMPSHTSFYMGTGMKGAPKPNINGFLRNNFLMHKFKKPFIPD